MPKAHQRKVSSRHIKTSSANGGVFSTNVASSNSRSSLLTPPSSPERTTLSKSKSDVPLYTPPPRKRHVRDTPDESPLRLILAGVPGSPTKRKVKQLGVTPTFSMVPRPLKPPMPSREELKAELARCKPALVQTYISDDPWRVLVATMLLNVTTGRAAMPVFWELMRRWPTADAMSRADPTEILPLIGPLGLQNKRTARLIDLSTAYITNPPISSKLYNSPQVARFIDETGEYAPGFCEHPYRRTHVSHLPGLGRYALDSYRIFCWMRPANMPGENTEWMSVYPHDKELVRYVQWKWAVEVEFLWSDTKGLLVPLRQLPDEIYGQLIANCRELTYYGEPPADMR